MRMIGLILWAIVWTCLIPEMLMIGGFHDALFRSSQSLPWGFITAAVLIVGGYVLIVYAAVSLLPKPVARPNSERAD